MQVFQHAAELHSAGRILDALALYDGLAASLPQLGHFWHFYGLASFQAGDSAAAQVRLRRALLLSPQDASCLNRFACIFLAANMPEEARRHLRHALALSPNHAEGLYNCGEAERLLGNNTAALACLDRATAACPEEAGWQLSRAKVLHELDRLEDARSLLESLADSELKSSEYFFQMGRTLFEFFEADAAITLYRRALLLTPAAAEGYNNLQLVLRSVGRQGEGVRSARYARTIRPGDPVLEYNLADSLLAAGDIHAGFARYGWRHRKDEVRIDRLGLPAEWDGRPATDDKALLLCHEQGIGDEIRLVSCVTDTSQMYGGRVVLESDARLVPLFERSFKGIEIVEKVARSGTIGAVADYNSLVAERRIGSCLMLGDMPRYVRPDLNSFPTKPGFLIPDPEERARWREQFEAAAPRHAVGFCWRSGMRRPAWRHNDMKIQDLAPIIEQPGILPVCLQYDEYEAEVRAVEEMTGTKMFRPEGIDQRNELDRVAAMISALDMVISVDTSVLLIAGAVGTPAIGLHSARSALFFGAQSDPWLPSERSLVKGGNRSWTAVIEEATPLMEEMLAARP
ncbi:tetratricopeptide repeat protein [Nisaea sediminum]|uniref:tetratricopeptide repeat protein n=1 Tax=Nisaea sediminum TaxID=2775867 RepID=UPI0018666041|nr:glycosyltransferase family 9 protein [Nisaea sediminum]